MVPRYLEIFPGETVPIFVKQSAIRDDTLPAECVDQAVMRSADVLGRLPQSAYSLFISALLKWRAYKYHVHDACEQADLYELMSSVLDSAAGGQEARATPDGLHMDVPRTLYFTDFLMVTREMRTCWSIIHLEQVAAWPKLQDAAEGLWFTSWANWADRSAFVLKQQDKHDLLGTWKEPFMRAYGLNEPEESSAVPAADVQLIEDASVHDDMLGPRTKHHIQASVRVDYTMTFNASAAIIQAIVDELDIRTRSMVQGVSVGPLNTCTVTLAGTGPGSVVSDLMAVLPQLEQLNSLAGTIYEDILKVLETIDDIKYRGVYRPSTPPVKVQC